MRKQKLLSINKMKKRIRKTGEIVDVIDYYNLMGTKRDSNDSISYIDSKGEEHHHEKGLNLWWDFEDVVEVPNTNMNIDWEEVRIKAAISALQGFTSNPNSTSFTDEELALWSTRVADALIAELKKGGEK